MNDDLPDFSLNYFVYTAAMEYRERDIKKLVNRNPKSTADLVASIIKIMAYHG